MGRPGSLPSVYPEPLHADVRLDARHLVRELVLVMVGLEVLAVLLDLWLHCGEAIPSYELRELFDATREGGLSSWLAVTQAGLVALTVWAVVALYRHAGLPRAQRIGWTALAVFFTYLAFDDGTRLHERFGTAFDESAASEGGVGAVFPSYYWQLLLGPFFAAMGLFMLVFLWRTLRERRLRLLLCGALALLALAVAMDFVEGLNPAHPLNLYAALAAPVGMEPHAQAVFGPGAYETAVHIAMALEESVEMTAMTMLWAVFLLHAAGTVTGVRLRWSAGDAEGLPVAAVLPGHVL